MTMVINYAVLLCPALDLNLLGRGGQFSTSKSSGIPLVPMTVSPYSISTKGVYNTESLCVSLKLHDCRVVVCATEMPCFCVCTKKKIERVFLGHLTS